jgi:hypothetical protein
VTRCSGAVVAAVLWEGGKEGGAIRVRCSYSRYTPCDRFLPYFTRPDPLRILLRMARYKNMCSSLHYIFTEIILYAVTYLWLYSPCGSWPPFSIS